MKAAAGGKAPTLVGRVKVVANQGGVLEIQADEESALGGPNRFAVKTNQIASSSEIGKNSQPGDVGQLTVSRWLAETNGWLPK